MIDFIITVLASILAAMGVGGGGLLIVYLSLAKELPQITSQGINLICFLPSAAISVLMKLKELKGNFKLIAVIAICGTAASVLSSVFVGHIKSNILRIMFGILLVFSGVYQFFSEKKKGKVSCEKKDGDLKAAKEKHE